MFTSNVCFLSYEIIIFVHSFLNSGGYVLNYIRSFIFILIFSGSILASGFQINEMSARAMSMGGAFTGLATDASAVYFNPGAITHLEGTQVMAGFTYIKPNASFRGVTPDVTEYKLNEQFFNPINFYITKKLTKKLSVGFGVNNPFGLGTVWDDDWVGNKLAVDTEITTFFFNPVVAYQLTDCVSVGLGFTFAYGDVFINRKVAIAPFEGEGEVTLKGDGYGYGYLAAIYLKPSKYFSLGVSFRSEVEFDFKGDGTTEQPSQLAGILPNGKISAPLTTPMNLTVGIALHPMEKLTVTADFQYVGWSSYDKLEVTYEEFTNPSTGQNYVSSSKRKYENSNIIRGGAEYNLTEKFDLRCGILYDNNPVKDKYVEPTLPDANRLGLNVGLGYKLTESLAFDVAYLYLRFDEREIKESHNHYAAGNSPFLGTYNSHAHLVGLNFSYKF